MSQFTQSALERIKEKVAYSIGIGRVEYSKWEVPYDLVGDIPKFTTKAVEEVITELNRVEFDGGNTANGIGCHKVYGHVNSEF